MEGRFCLEDSSRYSPNQKLFKQKNVKHHIGKAVGKCGRDKGRWKTEPKRYCNERAHEKENGLMNTWYQVDKNIVMGAGDCF